MAEPSDDKINAQFAEMMAIEQLNGDPVWQQMIRATEFHIIKLFQYLEERGIHGVTGFTTNWPTRGLVIPVFKIQRTNEEGKFDEE